MPRESPSETPNEQAMKKAMTSMVRGVGAEVRKAAVAARAEGVVTRRQPNRANARRRCKCMSWPKAGAFWLFAGAVLLISLASEPAFLKEMARTAGAVADAAEGAGSLAGAVTHAAANATVAVTSTAAGIASTSLTLAREAWLGIDLLNISANRSHGRVVAANLSLVIDWAKLNPSFSNIEMDIDALLLPALSVSPELPFAEWSDSRADLRSGVWSTWRVWARWGPTSRLAVAFEIHTVHFTARWSNPLWEALEVDHCSASVLSVLNKVLATMPPVPSQDLSLSDIAIYPEASPPPLEQPRTRAWWLIGLTVVASIVGLCYARRAANEDVEVWHSQVVSGPPPISIATPEGSIESSEQPPLSPLEHMRSAASGVLAGLSPLTTASSVELAASEESSGLGSFIVTGNA